MNERDAVQARQEALLEEAMDWLILLREMPDEPSTLGEWQAWVQKSDAHLVAWNRICRTWDLLGHLPEATLPPPTTDTHIPAIKADKATCARRPPSNTFKYLRASPGLGLAAFAAIAIAITFAPILSQKLAADIRTGNGETRVAILEDGSSVTLAPDSAIALDMNNGVRRVRLLSGEALFEVVRDETRPFLVDTQDAEIRVLGTAFNVQETENSTRVELAHGAILLRLEEPTPKELSLYPGDVVTIDHHKGIAEQARMDPRDIALWRQGQLAVMDQSVATVVELMQRFHPAWIVVADSRLNNLRVSGLYDMNSPDKALSALVEPFGLKVRPVSSHVRLISAY